MSRTVQNMPEEGGFAAKNAARTATNRSGPRSTTGRPTNAEKSYQDPDAKSEAAREASSCTDIVKGLAHACLRSALKVAKPAFTGRLNDPRLRPEVMP